MNRFHSVLVKSDPLYFSELKVKNKINLFLSDRNVCVVVVGACRALLSQAFHVSFEEEERG